MPFSVPFALLAQRQQLWHLGPNCFSTRLAACSVAAAGTSGGAVDAAVHGQRAAAFATWQRHHPSSPSASAPSTSAPASYTTSSYSSSTSSSRSDDGGPGGGSQPQPQRQPPGGGASGGLTENRGFVRSGFKVEDFPPERIRNFSIVVRAIRLHTCSWHSKRNRMPRDRCWATTPS